MLVRDAVVDKLGYARAVFHRIVRYEDELGRVPQVEPVRKLAADKALRRLQRRDYLPRLLHAGKRADVDLRDGHILRQ